MPTKNGSFDRGPTVSRETTSDRETTERAAKTTPSGATCTGRRSPLCRRCRSTGPAARPRCARTGRARRFARRTRRRPSRGWSPTVAVVAPSYTIARTARRAAGLEAPPNGRGSRGSHERVTARRTGQPRAVTRPRASPMPMAARAGVGGVPGDERGQREHLVTVLVAGSATAAAARVGREPATAPKRFDGSDAATASAGRGRPPGRTTTGDSRHVETTVGRTR